MLSILGCFHLSPITCHNWNDWQVVYLAAAINLHFLWNFFITATTNFSSLFPIITMPRPLARGVTRTSADVSCDSVLVWSEWLPSLSPSPSSSSVGFGALSPPCTFASQTSPFTALFPGSILVPLPLIPPTGTLWISSHFLLRRFSHCVGNWADMAANLSLFPSFGPLHPWKPGVLCWWCMTTTRRSPSALLICIGWWQTFPPKEAL